MAGGGRQRLSTRCDRPRDASLLYSQDRLAAGLDHARAFRKRRARRRCCCRRADLPRQGKSPLRRQEALGSGSRCALCRARIRRDDPILLLPGLTAVRHSTCRRVSSRSRLWSSATLRGSVHERRGISKERIRGGLYGSPRDNGRDVLLGWRHGPACYGELLPEPMPLCCGKPLGGMGINRSATDRRVDGGSRPALGSCKRGEPGLLRSRLRRRCARTAAVLCRCPLCRASRRRPPVCSCSFDWPAVNLVSFVGGPHLHSPHLRTQPLVLGGNCRRNRRALGSEPF